MMNDGTTTTRTPSFGSCLDWFTRSRIRHYSVLSILGLLVISFAGTSISQAQDLPPTRSRTGRDVESQDAKPTDGEVTDGAKLVFESLEYDFGNIYDTESVTCVFEFTNEGNQLLTIDKIRPGCGCTTTDIEIRDYLPGERGSFEVTFNPTNRSGPQKKSPTVLSNDPNSPSIKLTIKCKITPAIDTEDRHTSFGTVIHGQSQTKVLKLVSPFEKMEITTLDVSGPNLTVNVLETKPVKLVDGTAVQESTVEVVLNPDAPRGHFNHSIHVVADLTGEDGVTFEHKTRISMSANIVGDIEPRPNRLSFGRLEPGEDFSRQLRLRSRTRKDFKILGIKTQKDDKLAGRTDVFVELEAEHDMITDGTDELLHRVTLNGVAPDEPGRFFGFLVVETDHPDDPVIEIRYYGIVAK